jgi:cell division protein ZapA
VTLKNKVEVRICGKDYTLVGVESDDYIQKVGLYIDKKMNEITRTNNKLSTSMAAVLTAINVADDFFKALDGGNTAKRELKHALEELDRQKNEIHKLSSENTSLNTRNTSLQLELAKREAELSEVRNLLDKATKPEYR